MTVFETPFCFINSSSISGVNPRWWLACNYEPVARSKDGLCCDPDADDPPLLKGVMGSRSKALHYVAISGGWIAVLVAIILGRVS